MAINPKIKQKAEDIRKKIFGTEVRESLASGIEAISEDVEATIGRQDYVEEQFQDVLDETTDKDVISAPELIAARNGKSNLKTRLDDEHAQVTAQLQQKTTQLINAQGVGFIGDGITDNSPAMADFLLNYSGATLYFPKGTYCFSNTIATYDNCHIEIDAGAELKLTSPYNVKAFIDMSGSYTKGSYIKGPGIINGNYNCDYAVRISRLSSPRICDGIQIQNFNKAGIKTSLDINNRSSNTSISDIYISNDKPVLGSIGLLDDAYDNNFTNVTIRDVDLAIDTTSSKFNRVHAWVAFKELLPTSTYCILRSSECSFVNCTSDTLRYGFISGYEGTKNDINLVVSISNFSFFFNKGIYTAAIAATYKPVLFKSYTNSNGVTSKVIPNFTNGTITGHDFPVSLTDITYGEAFSKNVNIMNLAYDGYIDNDSITFDNSLKFFKDMNTLRYRDGATNYDSITVPGTYTVNTFSGTGGTNVPAMNTFGLLTVFKNSDVGVQTLYTKSSIMMRQFTISGNAYTFSKWYTFNVSTPDGETVNGSTNYDTLTTTNTYYIDTYQGSGGVNVPTGMVGTLDVRATGKGGVQIAYGKNKTLTRRFIYNTVTSAIDFFEWKTTEYMV